MKVIRSAKIMQQQMIKLQSKQIGFVPTMGFFHEGHTSLMKQAREENDLVVVSIFVNPLQFGPSEDFETYPRNEAQDIKIAQQLGVDFLFVPDVQNMYPREMSISMHADDRVNVLCGRSRPGHFDGVVLVLTKLFNIIQPDHAYFGMKDAQQVAVVEGLITDFNFPIKLVGLPTVREESGLAKSSRNVYLNKDERKESIWLHKALTSGKQLVVDGEKNPATIIKEVKEIITNHTTATIDYIELLSYPALQPVSDINEQVILAIAVNFKQVRLIDNLLMNHEGEAIKRF